MCCVYICVVCICVVCVYVLCVVCGVWCVCACVRACVRVCVCACVRVFLLLSLCTHVMLLIELDNTWQGERQLTPKAYKGHIYKCLDLSPGTNYVNIYRCYDTITQLFIFSFQCFFKTDILALKCFPDLSKWKYNSAHSIVVREFPEWQINATPIANS